jgi:hypothetical protein
VEDPESAGCKNASDPPNEIHEELANEKLVLGAAGGVAKREQVLDRDGRTLSSLLRRAGAEGVDDRPASRHRDIRRDAGAGAAHGALEERKRRLLDQVVHIPGSDSTIPQQGSADAPDDERADGNRVDRLDDRDNLLGTRLLRLAHANLLFSKSWFAWLDANGLPRKKGTRPQEKRKAG